jgi:hypothetical protein
MFYVLCSGNSYKKIHKIPYFRQTCAYSLAVLRIRDVYPGSRILIFTHPGSRISDPGSKNSNKIEVKKNFFVVPFM